MSLDDAARTFPRQRYTVGLEEKLAFKTFFLEWFQQYRELVLFTSRKLRFMESESYFSMT